MTVTETIAKKDQLAWVADQCAAPEPAALVLQRIMTYVHQNNPGYHWVGLYLLHGDVLRVGPYAGPVTDHTEIPVGRGVCGTAVAEMRDQVVDDVAQLDNYLACNLETKSEMVALIYGHEGIIVGQLDIDAREHALFDLAEQSFVRSIATAIATRVADLHTEHDPSGHLSK